MPPPPPILSLAGMRFAAVAGHQIRTFVEARIPWVRDRALDHAVEKEKHLLPFHSLKDLVVSSSSSSSSPTPSLLLSTIAARRADLRLPFRAIRFIRLFPAAFLESHPPPPSPPSPLISPTPDLLSLHADELHVHSSRLPDAASRLLRLLMLAPRRRLPLCLVHRLRWDLGLPHDFRLSLLPDYPDYFVLSPSLSNPSDLDLELVLYNKDLAVSAMEQLARRTGGYDRGSPLPFPMSFPRGFELEKKVRKWVDEWQRLPYISPYEDASHLAPRSDFFEKWTVGMIHEVLSLFVSKKTKKENLEILAGHLGLRPGFKKVIAHHPGIFYVSNKLRTQTVVLREAYSRDLLVEKHPLMGLRYQYIHLMHKGKERDAADKDKESKHSSLKDAGDGEKLGDEGKGEEEDWDDEDEQGDEEEFSEAAGFDTEDEESEDDDDDDVEDEEMSRREENTQVVGSERIVLRGSFNEASRIERSLRTGKILEMHREQNAGGRRSRRSDNYSRTCQTSSKRRVSM